MRRSAGLVMLACGLLVSCRAAAPVQEQRGPWNLPGGPPHLIAHYLPWYEVTRSAEDPTRTWNHWKFAFGPADHDPERVRTPAGGTAGLRDIASTVYPLIGPYASSSPHVVRYHLATAQAAGVQAFAVLWYGPGNTIDSRLPLILDEADKLGMKVALCYEEKINFPDYRHPKTRDEVVDSVVADLNYILERYATHRAYLRRGGQPFIFQFNYWGVGKLGPNNLTPGEWKRVFERLSGPVVYARQNLNEAYHRPIAGAYVWWTEDDEYLRTIASRAAALRAEGRLDFFMAMVCPGFDDTGVWGWGQGPRKSRHYGLDELRRTFAHAGSADAELIQLVTWNDFNEATCFEPTVEHGFLFVDELEKWWGGLTGRPVDLSDNRAAYKRYLRTCTPEERALLP